MTNLLNTGSGSEAEPAKLPTGEKFELYVDEDGDYVLTMKDRPHHHISVHADNPAYAVEKMVDTIHELDAMGKQQYVYVRTASGYEVGFYKTDGTWQPESTHANITDAFYRLNHLNGNPEASR